ncbi:hypothetical protein LR48_Vigan10g177800 [Vigna angularis]|uniref:Uncharacterized protein n=1 Tax=Phaseolus angularis TaxID=3914 RepID=A0A0L9VLE3_PHAAN|nr:hypothetical protein LR48_Vigan10g177800 [Vigna angularis]
MALILVSPNLFLRHNPSCKGSSVCFFLTFIFKCDLEVVVYEGVIREKATSKEDCPQFLKDYFGGHAATVGSVLVSNLKTRFRKGDLDRVEKQHQASSPRQTSAASTATAASTASAARHGEVAARSQQGGGEIAARSRRGRSETAVRPRRGGDVVAARSRRGDFGPMAFLQRLNVGGKRDEARRGGGKVVARSRRGRGEDVLQRWRFCDKGRHQPSSGATVCRGSNRGPRGSGFFETGRVVACGRAICPEGRAAANFGEEECPVEKKKECGGMVEVKHTTLHAPAPAPASKGWCPKRNE